LSTITFIKQRLRAFFQPISENIRYFFLRRKVNVDNKVSSLINYSTYISRDLSWLKFNYRVLDQVNDHSRSVFDKLKFLTIAYSNLDEFFQIRVGSLYNYLDFDKPRIDNSGLTVLPFKKKLFEEVQVYVHDLYHQFKEKIIHGLEKENIYFIKISHLSEPEKEAVSKYFSGTIYPMLTPMLLDSYHIFPVLLNKLLYFGVVTLTLKNKRKTKRLSFLQIPQNLPRFFEINRGERLYLLPIEDIIRWKINTLYRNVEIESATLFRIVRNGDFSVEDSDDADSNLLEEMMQNLKKRKTGRVVRVDMETVHSKWFQKEMIKRSRLEEDNFFVVNSLLDLNACWYIVNHPRANQKKFTPPAQVFPLSYPHPYGKELFEHLKHHDVLLHHPFNTMDYLVNLLENAAEDPNVLSIKITIYRLAKKSRISEALHKAAENGKHVSVLFEVKARFDEERNIQEAQRLQKAGCFVIYGVGNLKTHCKLMMIVRKDDNSDKITRYLHLSSGNYNEETAKLYTDVGLLTANETYANDVSELFNVITGHSHPDHYDYLITAPDDLRKHLMQLVDNEIKIARSGRKAGIVIKVNSLQDNQFISKLYEASQAGVKIKLIVRGICCLRPGRKDLSENITVRSIVGNYLEHTRLFYFHNDGDPVVYAGSADAMVRSFERRIECLYFIADPSVKKECINILRYNLKDNVNAYELDENGDYSKNRLGEHNFDIQQEFYRVTPADIENATVLF
jgi:polyphosphate kinase